MGAADYAAMRVQLGLVIGSNVQAFDADLAAIASLTLAQNKFYARTGSGSGVADAVILIGSDFSLSGNTLSLSSSYIVSGSAATVLSLTVTGGDINLTGSVIATDGLTGSALVISNGSFAATVQSTNLTANRAIQWPNIPGTVLVSNAGTVEIGTASSVDASIVLYNGSNSNTVIYAAGAPTGSLTLNPPVQTGTKTLAVINAAQSWTGVQSFTSPDITTSITTPSTTLAVFNATATTVNAFGATTSLNIGAAAALVLNFGGHTSAAELRFLEPSGSGTNYIGFKAAAMAASTTYVLPTVAATAGQVLSADSTPTNLKWIDLSAGSSLTSTFVGYGSGANALTGEAAFTYDASINTLTVENLSMAGTATIATVNATTLTPTNIAPAVDATTPLGDSTHGWSRIYMGSGGIISFASTNWVATHTSGILTVGTGDLRVTTAGTNTASVVTVGGTQSLTNKKLGSLTTNGLVTTSSSDGTLSVTVPGTGVLTALAVNVGSAGAFITFNGDAGTPSALVATNATGTASALNIGGAAASLSVSGQTGKITFTGLASTNRIKTVRDAADTILELGGSYTPTGTWTSVTMVTPVLGTPASGNLSNCTADGTNAVGYRNVPQNAKTGSYTLLATDVGKVVPNTTGGWTVNNSVHTAGDVITVYNDSGSSQNITAGTITTMRLAGTATTGTRALAQRGLATLYFQTASEVIVSGAGVT
jgi:hypothetical protein